MRVAIIAECFTPTWNGVTGSVTRILEHLDRRGHDAMVVAPAPGPGAYGPAEVIRVPAVTLPAYRALPLGLPTAATRRALERFRPDVVHLAAPVILGDAGARAAQALGVPAVAVYQTDLAGFARRYGLGAASAPTWAWLRRVHNRAAVTLAPSSVAEWDLRAHGVTSVARWARGVDVERWHPRQRRESLRRRLLGPGGETLVGFSGRLAPEKEVGRLAALGGLPGVRVVVIGDGPSRERLARQLPWATFLGYRSGDELAQLVASLDVFVHTGPHETFCQSVQEAMAAGIPVVAPAAGGPLDLVRHGETGWLFPVDRSGALRQAIGSLASDPVARRAMGAAGRRAVEPRTWTAVGDALLGHYEQVVGAATGRRAA